MIKSFVSRLFHKRNVFMNVTIRNVQPTQLLSGRCAFITGGTSGIGYAIARVFLESGAAVVITGRTKERIDNACFQLKKDVGHGVIMGCVLDNTNVPSFQPTIQNILHDLGEKGVDDIDILVNNAGIPGGEIKNVLEEDYDIIMDTNLKGVFFLTKIFGEYFKENSIRGNILNVASSSSVRPAISAYTLSKWGIRGFTLGMAKSLAPYGITVNGIAPGLTATPVFHKSTGDDLTNKNIPLGRYLLPEEIAQGALFLVSDMGRSVMGDILYMTGGAGLLSNDDIDYSF